MSRLSKFSEKEYTETLKIKEAGVQNFMGGISYKISPLNELRLIASSSIFGEPQYYRDGLGTPSNIENILLYSIEELKFSPDKTAVEVFEESIDSSLEFDFKETILIFLKLIYSPKVDLNSYKSSYSF
jgi:hypothetical protein